MEDLLIQIEKALEGNLYYLALYASLTLPDICAALSSTNGETNGAKYKAWYEQYARSRCATYLDGHTCYRLRCSSLHQGSAHPVGADYSRVVFIEPNQINVLIHNNIINSALQLDLSAFCRGMIAAVREWKAAAASESNYKQNYPKLMKRYPNGLTPYVGGISIIS